MGTLSQSFGASDAYTITLAWTELSQSVAKNQTALRFTCTLYSNRASATFTGYARADALTVGGTTVAPNHGDFTIPGGGSVLLWTWDMTVTHDADGTFAGKPVGFSVMIDRIFSASGWIGAIEAAGALTLTRIPRASTVSGGAFTAGTAGRITVTAASADFTHRLTAVFGSETVVVAENAAAGSLSWQPPLSLLAEIPDSTSGKGVLTCETYASGSKIGTNSAEFTLYVPDSVRPSVTAFAVEPVQENAVAAGWGLLLRTLTKLRWTASAVGSWGSTIRSAVFSCGAAGHGLSGTTAALTQSGAFTPTLTVTDSRGRTAAATLDPITVTDYAAPTLGTAAVRRCTAAGDLSPTGDCCLLNLTAACASVGGRNSLTLRWRLDDGGWQSLTDGLVAAGFAPDQSYAVTLSAIDALGTEKAVTLPVSAAEAALHLRDGGHGAAFGKYAEEDGLLDVGWNLRVRGLATFDDGETAVHLLGRGQWSGDLDDLNDTAVRFVDLSQCRNGPASDGCGLLETVKAGGDSGACLQRFTFYQTGAVCSRMYVNGQWYPWSS